MELAAVDLLAFMLFSQIAIAAYLLYSFFDQERESRGRTAALMAHVEKLLAELERRLATGAYRSTDELDRLIARHVEAAAPPSRRRRPPTPVSARPGGAKTLQ